MKNMYQCEKCGKLFESFDECYKCECSHREPSLVNRFDLPEDFDEPVVCFKDGCPFPSTVLLKFPKVDEENHTIYDERNLCKFDIVEYKRVDRHTKFMDDVEEGLWAEANRHEDEMEKWRAERKAKKEAEEKAEAEDCATDEIVVESREMHED